MFSVITMFAMVLMMSVSVLAGGGSSNGVGGSRKCEICGSAPVGGCVNGVCTNVVCQCAKYGHNFRNGEYYLKGNSIWYTTDCYRCGLTTHAFVRYVN